MTGEQLQSRADQDWQRARRYLTTEEFAQYVRVPIETARYWRHVGRGPKSIKLPGARRVLYDLADVEAWLAQANQLGGTA